MLNSLIGTVSPELKAKGLEARSQRVHHQRHNNDNNNKQQQQQQWQSAKSIAREEVRWARPVLFSSTNDEIAGQHHGNFVILTSATLQDVPSTDYRLLVNRMAVESCYSENIQRIQLEDFPFQ